MAYFDPGWVYTFYRVLSDPYSEVLYSEECQTKNFKFAVKCFLFSKRNVIGIRDSQNAQERVSVPLDFSKVFAACVPCTLSKLDFPFISFLHFTDSLQIVKEAKDEFVNLLKLSESRFTADTPLIIILDSLDQLSPEDGAFQLSWLPMKLPPWAKMVVSTISQDKYDCLKNLKVIYLSYF